MLTRLIHFLQFIVVLIVSLPFRFLPFSAIRAFGYVIGHILYYLFPRFRKRTLSNLALASKLKLTPKEVTKVAKESFVNLCITCLEYAKFKQVSDISRYVTCENPEVAEDLIKSQKGVIFFCAHQANWEVLFLEGSSRMPGVAIGRPIKNTYLYKWVQSIRQKFGGVIIPPKRAAWEGLRALKQHKFLGIVGDQGMPSSDFSSDFLGRRAFTSTIPALLAYKAKAALLTALIWRVPTGYRIRYTPPDFADTTKSIQDETARLMTKQLAYLEESIMQRPGEWLWQHNRWKQESPHTVYYRYRHETILIVSGKTTTKEELAVFRKIYPRSFLTFVVPHQQKALVDPLADEVITYSHNPPFLVDYRFKYVFDLSNTRAMNKYTKLSAFEVLRKKDMKKRCEHPYASEEELIVKTLCRGGHLPYAC